MPSPKAAKNGNFELPIGVVSPPFSKCSSKLPRDCQHQTALALTYSPDAKEKTSVAEVVFRRFHFLWPFESSKLLTNWTTIR